MPAWKHAHQIQDHLSRCYQSHRFLSWLFLGSYILNKNKIQMGLEMRNQGIGQLQILFCNFKSLRDRNLMTMKRMKSIHMFCWVLSSHDFLLETFFKYYINDKPLLNQYYTVLLASPRHGYANVECIASLFKIRQR